MIGYLDIETSFGGDVTVVGLLRAGAVVQLVGSRITWEAIEEALDGVDTLCTFNGEYFDLPVLHRALGVDLLERYRSLDLASICRREGHRGGLKRIESGLGIPRRLRGIGGYDAMVLWESWQDGDAEALATLLEYNREDVVNLVALEGRLRGDLQATPTVETLVVGPPIGTPSPSSNGTGPSAVAGRSLGPVTR